jgi:glycosyltransferase involved in cell wall biosynthesis
MNICMVAGHGCIRVHKMAIPLMERGHQVHLVAMKIPAFWELYKSFTLCADVEQMIQTLKLYAAYDIDLFHCHNEPSWFVSVLKEMTKKPVIMDVHDSYLARSTPGEAMQALNDGQMHIRVHTEERNNFQLADALVFPGSDFKNVVCGEFKLDQPSLVLPSYVPSRFYEYATRDWHGGLVYEGKVSLPEESKKRNGVGFSYCDYSAMADATHELGMDFHLYATRSDEPFKKHYAKALIHRGLAYEELIGSVSRHDWGLVGNIGNHREWEVAMPNKLFDYMAAGVPAVSMNAAYCSKFLDETKTGITVGSPEELAERWSEHREARKNVFKFRRDWAMDNHIYKLEAFYKEVHGAA